MDDTPLGFLIEEAADGEVADDDAGHAEEAFGGGLDVEGVMQVAGGFVEIEPVISAEADGEPLALGSGVGLDELSERAFVGFLEEGPVEEEAIVRGDAEAEEGAGFGAGGGGDLKHLDWQAGLEVAGSNGDFLEVFGDNFRVAFEEGGDLSAVFGELVDVGEAGVGIEEDFAEEIRAFGEDALAEMRGGDGVGFGGVGESGPGWG